MIHTPLSTRATAILALTASIVAMPAGPSHAAEPSAEELTSVLAEPVYGSARLAGASKYAQDLAEAPTVVYVRTAGEIRTQGYRTLAEVLESVPGVHLRSDRIYSHAGVRGINPPGDYSARLLVLIDGVRINEAIYDSATLGREFPLDVGLIERVEFNPRARLGPLRLERGARCRQRHHPLALAAARAEGRRRSVRRRAPQAGRHLGRRTPVPRACCSVRRSSAAAATTSTSPSSTSRPRATAGRAVRTANATTSCSSRRAGPT